MHSLALTYDVVMKVSRYCFATQSLVANKFLVFNTFSGSLLELESKEFDLIQPVLNGDSISTGNTALDNRLINAGVLVPIELDEISVIRENRKNRAMSQDGFGLTIAPTLQCNFRCDYCFESHPNQRMNKETEAALCQFIKERSKKSNSISITWYGGEPLMALDTVVRIQRYINKLGEKRGIPVRREMITNGYLLSPEAIQKMIDLGEWDMIQVTLDGDSEAHDSRRVLVSGKGTWSTIVKNCQNALDKGLPLVIRMNVDSTTPQNFDGIINQLMEANILQRANMYLGCLSSVTPENKHLETAVLQRERFAKSSLNFSFYLLNSGLPSQISLPTSVCSLCTADSEHGYVIAPSGLMFKCWEEIALGPNAAVGHLTEKRTPQQHENLRKWNDYDPLAKSGCVDCTSLPVCMGGCPIHARKKTADVGDCSSFRFYPHETIQIAHAEIAIQKHTNKEKKSCPV